MELNVNPPSEITVELMQQMFREVEKDNTIVVLPPLDVHVLNEEFHGGSCLSKVTVKYTRHGNTSPHSLSLIIKEVPKNTIFATCMQQSTIFPREIQMFDEILPRMSVLLSRALGDRHADFAARVYYTRKTPTYLIAIEDLSPKGFMALKRRNGLNLKHCLLALRTLARFHAASVKIHRENERLFVVFDKYSFQEGDIKEFMREMSHKAMNIVTEAVKSWEGFGPSWADRLRSRMQTLHDDLQPLWKRNDNGFNVLNHGDFGVHNLMFRHSDSSRELEAIMFVDFQCCSYNSPVLDLHQFIFGSASDEVRACHIDTLLTEYHVELTATLIALGEPREKILSLAHLLEEFDSKMLYGFYYATCVQPFLNADLDAKSNLTTDDILSKTDDMSKSLQSLITDDSFKSLKRQLPIFSQKQIF